MNLIDYSAIEWMKNSKEFRTLNRTKTIIGDNLAKNQRIVWSVVFVKDGGHRETKDIHFSPWGALAEAQEICSVKPGGSSES